MNILLRTKGQVMMKLYHHVKNSHAKGHDNSNLLCLSLSRSLKLLSGSSVFQLTLAFLHILNNVGQERRGKKATAVYAAIFSYSEFDRVHVGVETLLHMCTHSVSLAASGQEFRRRGSCAAAA